MSHHIFAKRAANANSTQMEPALSCAPPAGNCTCQNVSLVKPDHQRSGAGSMAVGSILVAVAAMCFSLGTTPALAASKSGEAIRLVDDLERNSPDFLFDMHGNAVASLQKLEILRFDATEAVESGIDRMERDPKRAKLVTALYQVLGFVKDPASTAWLERKLRSPQRRSIYGSYLPSWQDSIGFGFGNNEGFGGWPWLTGRDQWIDFFITTHDTESSADERVALMNILKGFDDPAAMRFFEAQRMTATDPREILLIEAYLHQHDVPVNGARISAAINALKIDPRNRNLLVGTADALRHEAFVPYLISTLDIAEQNETPPQYLSQYVLQDITFELDVEGKQAWNAWYSEHGAESREQWVQSAIASFKAFLKRDPVRAEGWFAKKASYRWNDLDALPLIRDDLVPRAEFHSDIAGWINMSYTEFRRPQLKPIADELARHPEQLEKWARKLLMERGFFPRPSAVTWEQYVRSSNRRL